MFVAAMKLTCICFVYGFVKCIISDIIVSREQKIIFGNISFVLGLSMTDIIIIIVYKVSGFGTKLENLIFIDLYSLTPSDTL